ncbi:MAG TPA: two-component regulator propeller domain-containing protein [Ohtaekwangia sp.]|uniref:sensor histidine kinase n=1 Tax=Ohtaekwangia sp. TaxID=2066019 RepID=UPI002F941A15
MYRCIHLLFPICLFLVVAARGFSQSRSYKNYTTDDGLPSSTIYASFQDSKGFMWFGSPLGVSRFDGYRFTHFTIRNGLSDNEVFNFFEDRSGRIWFLTSSGKVSYYHEGIFASSATDTTLRLLDSRSYISGMFQDDEGTLWFSTLRDGVVSYTRHKQVRRFFADNPLGTINGIYPTGRKKMVVVSRSGIITVQMSEDMASVLQVDTLGTPTHENLSLPRSAQLDAQNILFSSRGLVYSRNIASDDFNVFLNLTSNSLAFNNICQDADHIWICTTKGIFPYSKRTKKFLSPFFQQYKVTSVMKDREGNNWITTLDGGVFFCSEQDIYSYTREDGLHANTVTCLAKDSAGAIWWGHENGAVGIYRNGTIHSKIIANDATRDNCRVRKIYRQGNKCWIATILGLYLLEDHSVTNMVGSIRDIIEYPKDHLWMGTSDRIFKMSRTMFNRYRNDFETLPENGKVGYSIYGTLVREKLNALFLDSQKNIWIATNSHLYKGIADSLLGIAPDKFNDKVLINDFDDFSDNTLLLATNGDGVLFFHKDTYTFTSIGEEHGMTSGVCNAVATDESGAIWVATNKGLNKITGYPHNIHIEHYTIFDGMLSNEITDVLVSNDTVWVATKEGVNLFNKNLLRKKDIEPLMYLEDITVQGKSPVHFTGQQALTFAHQENDIRIRFVSPLYNSTGEVLYRYKLHREAPWKYTRDPFVYFPELAWDDYEFIVSAQGRAGIWSREASLSFTIQKPFWRSNLFIVTVILLLAAAIAAVVAWYIHQQKTRALWQQKALLSELRTLRAQMNPHFIFNALNSIHALFLKNDSDAAQQYIGRFGKLMRSILDRSEEVTIPIREELASVTDYLEIEKLRMNHNFRYSIDIDASVDIHTREMPSMILQPFIENSIWHGFRPSVNDPQLYIRLTVNEDDALIITMKDNGVGRKRSQALKNNHHSKGITLIRDRIEIINFERQQKIALTIEDMEDEQGNHPGTLVTLKIPYL